MSDADNKRTDSDKPLMFQSQSMATGEAGNAEKAAPTPAGLLAGYQRGASAFDELLAENGQVRPHYAKLIGRPGGTQRRRNSGAVGTPASGSCTNRASPTMSMAIRAAWSGRGNWTRFLSSSRRTNGRRLKPD